MHCLIEIDVIWVLLTFFLPTTFIHCCCYIHHCYIYMVMFWQLTSRLGEFQKRITDGQLGLSCAWHKKTGLKDSLRDSDLSAVKHVTVNLLFCPEWLKLHIHPFTRWWCDLYFNYGGCWLQCKWHLGRWWFPSFGGRLTFGWSHAFIMVCSQPLSQTLLPLQEQLFHHAEQTLHVSKLMKF